MQKLHILIVEDEKSQRELLKDFLFDEGFNVVEAANGEQAVAQIQSHHVDVMLTDFKMPGMDGIEVLEQVKQINPQIDVIMMTAYGTIDTAVHAMKSGAIDYLTKPVELEELMIQLERIAERRILIKENEMLRERLQDKAVSADHIIFASDAMQNVVNLAGRVSSSNVTVLIQGESGTGKELLAQLIHTLSPRAKNPMITVNCTALSENLLESELFGHEKGAFTGADRRRIGRFEEADQGTLFLDEIGELSQSVQVKLLRFLQQKEFQRVGGNQTLVSDVRIISATNKNLKDRVQQGLFREDLLYRLNVLTIDIPPLRERKQDIPLLIDHFLTEFTRKNARHIQGITHPARNLLMSYDYPGNIRELENIIERAVVITRGENISPSDLPFTSHEVKADVNQVNCPAGMTLNQAIEYMEQNMIRQALQETSYHQTRAAESLGISERMLRYKMKKYHIAKNEN